MEILFSFSLMRNPYAQFIRFYALHTWQSPQDASTFTIRFSQISVFEAASCYQRTAL